MRTIVSIGAYERDNFGDYLFFEVLQRYLHKDRIIPCSVIAGNVINEYGIVTIPYDFVLKTHRVDCIWVVGGELGGVDIESAMAMSLSESRQQYLKYSSNQREIVEKMYGANRINPLAYIPNKKNYQLNKDTLVIVNSVGLSHLSTSNQAVLKTMNGVDYLSVRDSQSIDKLREIGLKATLSPDAVHSLPMVYKSKPVNGVGILVQCNKAYIKHNGIASIATSLVDTALQLNQPITFVAAGLANGHDSIEEYDKVAAIIRAKGVIANIVTDRSPLEIVDYIASANITISTSLHVRIVSSAYGVARISLENNKVSQYAKQWDEHLPYNIDVGNISEAALGLKDLPETYISRDDLSELAYQNLKRMADNIGQVDSKNMPVDSNNNLFNSWVFEQLRATLNLIHRRESLYEKLNQQKSTLDNKIESLSESMEYYKKLHDDTLCSKSYRIGRKITSPYRFISKRIKGLGNTIRTDLTTKDHKEGGKHEE